MSKTFPIVHIEIIILARMLKIHPLFLVYLDVEIDMDESVLTLLLLLLLLFIKQTLKNMLVRSLMALHI